MVVAALEGKYIPPRAQMVQFTSLQNKTSGISGAVGGDHELIVRVQEVAVRDVAALGRGSHVAASARVGAMALYLATLEVG